MNNNPEIEQFTQDVERTLHHGLPGGSDNWSESRRREMEIVYSLAGADFSSESLVRQTLKRRLLATRFEKNGQLIKSRIPQSMIFRFSIAVLLTILLILASTPLGKTVAQTLIETVQTWRFGEHTTAVNVEGDFEAIPDANGDTIILPAEESPAVQDEIEPEVEVESSQGRYITLDPAVPFERAQGLVTFTLRQPAFTPDGYEFQGVVLSRPGQASLEYFNWSENRLMGLMQTEVGDSEDDVQVTFTSDMLVEDVTMGGVKALWTQDGDEGLLIWEADGVSYQLAGLSDVEFALQVAESIR